MQDAYTDVLRETQNERLKKMIAEDVGYMGGRMMKNKYWGAMVGV